MPRDEATHTILALIGNPRILLSANGGVADFTKLGLLDIIARWTDLGAKPAFPLMLCPSRACAIMMGRWRCLHVALASRRWRQVSLVLHEPSRRQMMAFRKASTHRIVEDNEPADGRSRRGRKIRRRFWQGQLEDSLMIAWLDASSFLKDVRLAGRDAASFSRVFTHSGAISRRLMMQEIRLVCPELLRKGRVRLDCVAMLLFRRVFQSLLDLHGADNKHIFVHSDSSPQWRGVELFASSFDIVAGNQYLRRAFPMISLERSRMDAPGKTLIFLW